MRFLFYRESPLGRGAAGIKQGSLEIQRDHLFYDFLNSPTADPLAVFFG
jgi:hypothetical protein